MGGARRIATGAMSLASLWLREWEALLGYALLAFSPAARRAQRVLSLNGDQVMITLTGADGTEASVERYLLQDWTRERLSRAVPRTSSRLRGPKAVTVLSIAQVVTGSLIVPQQARSQAGEIVRDHLMRKMPISLEDLVLGYEIRAGAAGKLELRYLAAPKVQVESALAQLSLCPTDIDALQGPAVSNASPVTIAYGSGPVGRRPWILRSVSLLGLVAILAPAAGFVVQAWRQNVVLAALEMQIAPLAEQARTSTERLKSVYSMADDLGRLAELRHAPGVVEIWDELARLLPDTTYLTAVEIKGRELHAEGLSASTADLVHRFEEANHLHAAALTGPVVFDRAHGKERFTLRAMIRTRRFPSGEGE